MRPKSGLKKRKALRNKAVFTCGFSEHPEVTEFRSGEQSPKSRHKFSIVSLFSGCGGMDIGFLGGFQYLGAAYTSLPFRIRRGERAPPCQIAGRPITG